MVAASIAANPLAGATLLQVAAPATSCEAACDTADLPHDPQQSPHIGQDKHMPSHEILLEGFSIEAWALYAKKKAKIASNVCKANGLLKSTSAGFAGEGKPGPHSRADHFVDAKAPSPVVPTAELSTGSGRLPKSAASPIASSQAARADIFDPWANDKLEAPQHVGSHANAWARWKLSKSAVIAAAPSVAISNQVRAEEVAGSLAWSVGAHLVTESANHTMSCCAAEVPSVGDVAIDNVGVPVGVDQVDALHSACFHGAESTSHLAVSVAPALVEVTAAVGLHQKKIEGKLESMSDATVSLCNDLALVQSRSEAIDDATSSIVESM